MPSPTATPPGLPPFFHWDWKFPEVFSGETPGFDVVVGTPPFGGKNTIIDANGDDYLLYLKQQYPQSHGNADLSAYFFRCA